MNYLYDYDYDCDYHYYCYYCYSYLETGIITILGGDFKNCLFSLLFGEDVQLD